jgi:tight adherence protein C
VLLVAAVVVFLAVAGGTSLLVLRYGGMQGRALDRLQSRPQAVSPLIPSPALIWQDLVSWTGRMVPSAPKSLPVLKRRLIRAGLRDPAIIRFFYGARICSTVLLAAGALLAGLRAHVASDNLFLLTGAAAVAGFMAPMRYLLWRISRRIRAIQKALPNMLDLMVVCVESGLGLDQTVLQVATELRGAHPELCSEFAVMNLELRAGKRRVEALHNLADRTGAEDVRKLVAVLVQTDKFGTSIGPSLRGHAEFLRVMARQRAEEKASKLAVKLVFPIFFCVLPSLFVVTIGPVITHLVRDLFPMIENM